MQMNQIAAYVNAAFINATGREDPILNVDLSNVVDAGLEFDDLTSAQYEEFVSGLINPIGRQIFVDRPYDGMAPSLSMDSWEYGGLAQKISSYMPEVTTSENWQLVDGQSYDPNVFHGVTLRQKFYSKRTTFTIERSVYRKPLKQAFTSAAALNAYMSMLENEVRKALTIAKGNLIMATLDNMIGEMFYEVSSAGTYTGAGTSRCINLLYGYNNTVNAGGTALTAVEAIYNKDFLRYAAGEIKKVAERVKTMSTVFNIAGEDRFTPAAYAKLILHADFVHGANTYLQGEVFHNNLTALPAADTVAYWQGSGDSFAFADTSAIDVDTTEGHTVSASGILGVLLDREACAVTNYDPSVRTQYNAKGDFTNYWYEEDAGYLNDFGENFVVFYVA